MKVSWKIPLLTLVVGVMAAAHGYASCCGVARYYNLVGRFFAAACCEQTCFTVMRPVRQLVWEPQQITCYKTVWERVVEPRTVTVTKYVRELCYRDVHWTVLKPVWETCVKEVPYTVMKPVWRPG